ncbi:AraC family transcriptional regulator [Allokutzneria sp. NRRL B-24872]|uniref:AraC family transcriptional regulator n=1 Tax=Allokutzneria sp. NRRL B-24872 TaxID=1137961 RepID=UPI000A3AFEE6|nr:AraC family transcriptional regulator [Allokutzneria sp. NRRL B-24872]
MKLDAEFDPLAEALHALRMTGVFYCRSEFTAPWGVTLPPVTDCLWFHVVTAGRCVLEVEGAEPRTLLPGDLVLVPHGRGHVLRGTPDAPVPAIEGLAHDYVSDRYAILQYGGGGAETVLVCGAVRFDHPTARYLVDLLPKIIHVEPAGAPQAEWMQSTLRLIAAEAATLRPGGEAVITRLSDILVVQGVRSWLENDPSARTGWLGALRDSQIGRALTLVHREPEREWTVASLASELAMSRSAFAARFTDLVGEPAMQYVTRWRMLVALDVLRTEGASVATLAGRLGYQSEAAFSRAFKRIVGVSPGSVKRVSPALATW